MPQTEQLHSYKADKSKLVTLEKGKSPPQAIDLERVVIGGIIADHRAMPEVYEILGDRSDVFYKDAHKWIYLAILDLYELDTGIDVLTISDQLKKNSKLDAVGGDHYIIGLISRIASTAHIEFHCRIILQKFVQRESIRVASNIIEKAYDDENDIFELLDLSQSSIDETSTFLNRKKPETLQVIGERFLMDRAESLSIPSKFTKLNQRMGGYHAPDLVILAARPGMGKTALIINEMKHQAKLGIAVGFLSLEMSSKQILGRLLSEEFGVASSKFKKNTLTPSERSVIKKEIHKVTHLPIHIRDEGALSVNDAKTTIGKWVRSEKVKIVYIDYLQLMTPGGSKRYGNREQEISYISGRLKAIAKEYEICIVALSQLSRAVETRGGSKRPMLSDLRESGAIEQDADVVAFIYRPEYYKIDEWEDGSTTSNQCELDIAKIREGEVGPTLVACNLKYMRFTDIEETPWEPINNSNPQDPKKAFEPINNDIPEEDGDEDDLPF